MTTPTPDRAAHPAENPAPLGTTHAETENAETAHSEDALEPVMVTGYTLWAVFRRNPAAPFMIDDSEVATAVAEFTRVEAQILAEHGVTLRGVYDVSGMRSDADVMIWIHSETPESLQAATRRLRRTLLLKGLLPAWNAMGVHRDAEFNKRHMPSFMLGKPPQQWVTVYPFVRSYEWYLLPDAERSAMLRDHGIKGSAFKTTLANTVASFALGDYEWILALEDDELLNLVDMMRDLRQTEARRHVREEIPFYTGRRISAAELVEVIR